MGLRVTGLDSELSTAVSSMSKITGTTFRLGSEHTITYEDKVGREKRLRVSARTARLLELYYDYKKEENNVVSS